MTNIEGVIFDCDGTLVDSERLGNDVLAEALVEQRFPISGAQAMARFGGMKLADCLDQIEAELGRKLAVDFVPDLRRRMADIFREKLQPVPGVMDLIPSITIPKCVASSGPREKIELTLSLTGLLDFFTGRIFSSYEEVGSWKPDPGIFLHAAKKLGIPRERCAVVEDSLPGIAAGVAAGMKVFAFQPDDSDPRIPSNVQVFHHMGELREWLR